MRELDALETLIYPGGERPPSALLDTKRVLAELRALLARPCLQHLARVMEVPREASVYELRDHGDAVMGQLRQAMVLQRRNGAPYVLLPEELAPAPDEALRAQLAPLLCPGVDREGSPCRRTRPYQFRAGKFFGEQQASIDDDFRSAPQTADADTCSPLQWERIETFETWIDCVAAHSRAAYGYSEDLTFRSIDRGWLMVRGKRGVYLDQLRLYDLQTGAAYVSAGRNAFSTCGGEYAAGMMSYAGTVSRDHIREIAFTLLTSPALMSHRAWPMLAELPADVPRRLAFHAPAVRRSSSDWDYHPDSPESRRPTQWAFSDGQLRARGSFRTLPRADYVQELLLLAEAGWVEECVPARLPPLADLLSHSRPDVPPDEHADRLADVVEQQLASLADRACPAAR